MLSQRPHAGRSLHGSRFDTAALRQEPLRLLHFLWRDQWLGAAVTVGIGAVSGLLVALAMPRGPTTASQTLAVMIAGFAVGLLAGLVLRSRWAMLLVPVAHVAVFELGRLGTDGPLVDGIQLDTTYGILALILGRGFHGLVGVLPMVLGVAYGAGFARRLISGPMRHGGLRRRLGLYARRTIGGLTTVGFVSLAVLIALPASTPPMLGADGEPLAGSVAELTQVRLGGHDQWIEIRGASADNPVLLFLNGGPGQSGLAFTRVFFADLAQDFVVVDWDQRGAGKSYSALDPTETWTLDQAVSDTIELTNYLRARFDEEKIYIMGESWGTTLGVLAVQRQPDLYHAYIGSGQMVSQRETDLRIYRDLLAYAEQTGDEAPTRKLQQYGEPPYPDVFVYGFVMGYYDKLAGEYAPPHAYDERGEASGVGPWGVLASEYSLVEKVNVLRGLMDMFAVMYPQLQEIDFRRDVPRLEVPIYILDGEHELSARRDLALEWYDQVEAPHKQLFTFENAGHSVAFEVFEELHQILTETVLPDTYPAP